MSTPKIIWYEGAIYHITTRGNRRSKIFLDEQDFRVYLNKLEDSLNYYDYLNYELISYCLMSNHVHLIIKTGKEPLTRIMGRLNSTYTKYFNKKYNYIGHLFQSRYFSELIKDDKQILEASRYIHLNPVRANIVKKPEYYKWSSYSMFIGKTSKKTINPEIILDYFSKRNRDILYKEFVENALSINKEGGKFSGYSG
ncbi:transposase [Clostridium botulinum]|uniref:REP-associated tyrosine transposase n=1 Tax=Clostridium TaxID=1485 RepID=UPI0013FCAB99|nr:MULTISPECIES: transposase [Clostridium]MCS6103248.1 transposase [Clostridium botulinum]MCS6106733.1 transposase [Clostridium botulinum]MCS6130627.1 transposase [Clostridium botulinum]NFL44483.1 transposase [Clostridium botulinum]NFL88928.1 transposase [Clostridium botulinum]